MAFAADWSNSIPADHTKLNTGPASVVAVRVAVSDRLATIVNGFVSGETSPIGILKLPFIAVSAPSTVTDQVQLYGKVVSAKTLLHMKDEDGTETQVVGKRTGDWLLSSNTTTPPDYTDVSATYADKFIRIGTTALSTGGSASLSGSTDSTTLTAAQSGSPAHSHGLRKKNSGAIGTSSYDYLLGADTQTDDASGTTKESTATAASSGHTHTLSASFTPVYVSIKVYSKN